MPRSSDVERAFSTEPWWSVFDPRLSLRARVAATVGIAAVVFVLLVNTLASASYRRHVERQSGPVFESLAAAITDKLDRAVLERHRQLQFLATLPVFHAGGDAVTDGRRVLDQAVDAAPDLAWVGYLRPDGTVAAASQQRFEGQAWGAQPWFQPAREHPSLRAPQEIPELAREIGETGEAAPPQFLLLALPVRNERGTTTGVLAAYLRWSLARDLQLSVVPDIARREQIGVTIYGSDGDVCLDSGGTGWNAAPAMPAVPGTRRNRGSLVEATPEGVEFLTGYALSREHVPYRGFAWFVAVRQPTTLVFAPARAVRRTLDLWGLPLVALLVLGAWMSMARVVRVLRSVSAAAHRIRAGDVMAVMPRPTGADEVARMTRAVGDLVSDLRPKSETPDTPAADQAKHPW